jgi:hypothetical protein
MVEIREKQGRARALDRCQVSVSLERFAKRKNLFSTRVFRFVPLFTAELFIVRGGLHRKDSAPG